MAGIIWDKEVLCAPNRPHRRRQIAIVSAN